MMTPLPFSGLSLLVHLGVIVFAFIAGLLGFKRARTKGRPASGAYGFAMQAIKPIVSVLILGFVGLLTTLFIWVAISTGIQSGANEPHRVFIEEVIQAVEEGNVRSLIESRIQYIKTSPLYPFTVHFLS